MDTNRSHHYPLRRRNVVEALLADRDDLLVVAGLGAPAWDVTAAGDTALNFPLWGAMGGAVPLGLGLALAQPERRVMVITGDGEMLMGIGSLATVALQAPANLVVIVLDNEHYGETGMQSTHTAGNMDLAAAAAASGIPGCETISDSLQLESALPRIRNGAGPVFYNVKIRAESLPLVLPPKEGDVLATRLRRALLGIR